MENVPDLFLKTECFQNRWSKIHVNVFSQLDARKSELRDFLDAEKLTLEVSLLRLTKNFIIYLTSQFIFIFYKNIKLLITYNFIKLFYIND